MNSLYRISLFAFLIGGLIFAYRSQWIIIRAPWTNRQAHAQQSIQAHKKAVKIWHFKQNKLIFEPQQIIWDEQNITLNTMRLVNAYLHLLYEENGIDKKIQVQAVTGNPTGNELCINFSHELFQEEQPIYTKWMLIEGLLQTVREQIPTLKTLFFLVNHRPMQDHHLDFSRPWPAEGFLTTTRAHDQTVPSLISSQQLCTIMIEPAGDAQYTGRVIDDMFERGITLQCAQELKKVLESLNKNCRVVLSRFPGEIVEPLQNAAFANRLKTTLYVAINMYQLPHTTQQTTDAVPEINVYHYLYHPTTDFWQRNSALLTCEPYHQAHVPQSLTSHAIAHTLFKNLKQIKPFAGELKRCAGLPLKSLSGIVAPAIIIELGIPHKHAWQALMVQLAQHINQLIH